jgi:pimeloyl-ACP methyl ester carboxylesterase
MTQPGLTSIGEGRYVRANGLDVYYQEYGSGEPLILLHAGLITREMNWAAYVPEFAEHFRVVVPDSRGHGCTQNPSGEFGYWLLAEDVAAFCRALGLDHPLICGYSDGGNVAIEVGMRFPDLPKALAVGGVWHEFSETYSEGVRALLCVDEEGNPDPDRMERENPHLAGILREAQQAQGAEHWQTLVKQVCPTWMTPLGYTREDFRKIQAPTLVYVGDRDELIPVEEAVGMYRMLANAELYVAPNRNHFTALGALIRVPLTDFLLRQITRDEG